MHFNPNFKSIFISPLLLLLTATTFKDIGQVFKIFAQILKLVRNTNGANQKYDVDGDEPDQENPPDDV